MKIHDDITPTQLVDHLASYWGVEKDSALAREIGVERGSIAHYRNRTTTDVQTKIIIALLRDIEYLEKKISHS